MSTFDRLEWLLRKLEVLLLQACLGGLLALLWVVNRELYTAARDTTRRMLGYGD